MSYELNGASPKMETHSSGAGVTESTREKSALMAPADMLQCNMDTRFPYSLGRDKYDNQPVQRVAATFAELKDEFLSARSNSKGQKYICAPMKKGPHTKDPMQHPGEHHFRCKEYVLPCRHLAFDLDAFGSVAIYEAFKLFMGTAKGFGYTTSSHTADKPRMRVILEVDRLMNCAERIKVSAALQAHVLEALGEGSVMFDKSVHRGEQPVYAPLTDAQVFDFNGDVTCVDLWLERYDDGLGKDLVANDDRDAGDKFVSANALDASLLPAPKVLERIEHLARFDKPELFAGNWQGQYSRLTGKLYESQSEAEMAMATVIARNARQLGVIGNSEMANCTLHVLHKTGLVRDKWRDHPTYLADTVSKAVTKTVGEVADPSLMHDLFEGGKAAEPVEAGAVWNGTGAAGSTGNNGAGRVTPLKSLQQRFALIKMGGEIRVMDRDQIAQAQSGAYKGDIHYYKRADATLLMQRELENLRLPCKPTVVVKEFWISQNTLMYDGVEFSPLSQPGNVLNFWTGPTITPASGDWALIRDHIEQVVCDGDVALSTYMLGFLAHALQHPEEKPGVMPVMLGGQGIGKGAMLDLIGKIWGRTTLVVDDVGMVVGHFNAGLERNFFVCLDEAVFAGDRKSLDSLKHLITDSPICIEQKYQPARNVGSVHRLIAASNHKQFAHVERDDRRFLFLRVSDKCQGDAGYFRLLIPASN